MINGDLVGLYKRRSGGQLTGDQKVELKKKRKEKDNLEELLKKKVDAQKRQQKFRNERKKTLAKLCETNQEISKAWKVRDKIGRPRLEIEQPDLLKAIVDIALHGSAAHEKRRSDVYRSIKTLQELTDLLVSDKFKLSRSGVYLRLLPKEAPTWTWKERGTLKPSPFVGFVHKTTLIQNILICIFALRLLNISKNSSPYWALTIFLKAKMTNHDFPLV